MLVRTRAAGMDLTGQEKAAEAIRAAFAAADPGPARLLAAGPAVFARDAARKIHVDVQLLSVVSTLLIVALLLVAFPLDLGDRRDCRPCAAKHRRRRARRAGWHSGSCMGSPSASA